MEYQAGTSNLNIDILTGIIFGGFGGAINQSALGNLVSSAAASLAASAINTWPLQQQEKFLSRQTALSAITITAVSSVSHMITKLLIDRHYEPKITYAKDCEPCKLKTWAERANRKNQSNITIA